jgi:integrase
LKDNHCLPVAAIASTGWPAFDSIYFRAWFAEAIEEAGLPDDCVLHGLRKCAACKLAEAGCSESEIRAVTGHKTTRMAEEYTRLQARSARRARPSSS